jgi:hypothetical protein
MIKSTDFGGNGLPGEARPGRRRQRRRRQSEDWVLRKGDGTMGQNLV